MLLKNGELNPDEFMEQIHNCETPISAKSMLEMYDIIPTENSQLIELNISPNPVNDILHIEFPDENVWQYDVSILDNTGVEIKIFSSVGSLEFNVSDLSSGIYFVKVLVGDKIFAGKFIKN